MSAVVVAAAAGTEFFIESPRIESPRLRKTRSMPSDLKRILLAAALAAAAFNATAPAKRAPDMPGAPPAAAAAVHAAGPIVVAEHRPRRIRIGRCGEDAVPFADLLEI